MKKCEHTVGEDVVTTHEFRQRSIIKNYKCPKCGDLIEDYYLLDCRYNVSKGVGEPIIEE